MTRVDVKQLAKESYNEYGMVVFRGRRMPEFEKLPEIEQEAWFRGARYAYIEGIKKARVLMIDSVTDGIEDVKLEQFKEFKE